MAAIDEYLSRQVGAHGGAPGPAGKATALDMLRNYHLPDTGAGHRQHLLSQPHAPAAAGDMEHHGLFNRSQVEIGKQDFQQKGDIQAMVKILFHSSIFPISPQGRYLIITMFGFFMNCQQHQMELNI